MKRNRLTNRELEALNDCIGFRLAGEIDPNDEVDEKALVSAKEKIVERLVRNERP